MGQRFRDVDAKLLYDGRRRRAAFWMRMGAPISKRGHRRRVLCAALPRSSRLRRGSIIIGGISFDQGRRGFRG